MDFAKLIRALEHNWYQVSTFATGEEAAAYLDGAIDGCTVGFGDSKTLQQIGLYDRLIRHNTVYDPNQTVSDEDFKEVAAQCLTTQVFLTSVNGISEDGVIVNLDSYGNRLAGSLYGHKKVYYVIGRNKIAPTVEDAVWRVRNVAAPRNAARLGQRTPCAVKGDRCYNCNSPDRICNGVLIELKRMKSMEMEVILIDEDLGL